MTCLPDSYSLIVSGGLLSLMNLCVCLLVSERRTWKLGNNMRIKIQTEKDCSYVAVLGVLVILMITSHKHAPPCEQVAFIRLKRVICDKYRKSLLNPL